MSPSSKPNLDKYLADQVKFKDSPLTKFLDIFELNLILKNLKPDKREEFITLLERENTEEILEFLGTEIPDLGKKLKDQISKKIDKVKQNVRKVEKQT